MHNPEHKNGLQLAFIGGSVTSAIGMTHYVASTMDNRFELAAGCFSKNAERNQQTAAAFNVVADRTYPDWQALLHHEAKRLDAVAVLTPIPAHRDIVEACLQADIPVICEKALAGNVEDVEAIRAMEASHNGFLAVTYNYSGYPMVRELKQRIATGELGQIVHFQVEMPQESFIRLDGQGNTPVPQDWRLHDLDVPTIYLDLGAHLHHLVHYLTGEQPLSVVADHASYGWFGEVIDNVNCLCRYSNNVMGQIWFSKAAIGHRNGLKIRVYGTEGSAEWVQMNPEELQLAHRNGQREIVDRGSCVRVAAEKRYNRFKPGHPDGFFEAFANLYNDIADALTDYRAEGQWRSEHVFGSAHALESARLLEAMKRSSSSRQWESLQPETVQQSREQRYGRVG